MAHKTIIINEDIKLSTRLENICFEADEEIFEVPIEHVSSLVLNYYKNVITVPLLVKLVKNNTNVVFCDEKNDPMAIVLPLNNHSRQFRNYSRQINWQDQQKNSLWRLIVKEKIRSEQANLTVLDKPSVQLSKLVSEVKHGDKTNREAAAARHYFCQLFGQKFTRDQEGRVNGALNYGYKILASHISKIIASRGYQTFIGIHHIGGENAYNLTYDFIETFRFVVDRFVFENIDDNGVLTMQDRMMLVNILNAKVKIENKEYFLTNAMEAIIDSYFNYLNKEKEDILALDYLEVKYE